MKMKKINIFKFFNVPCFIISLAIGLFLVYISTPNPNIILVYPNPDNEKKILYKDKSDTCYQCQSSEIKCPKDASKIVQYPIQAALNKGK